jgi:hypothetical protein
MQILKRIGWTALSSAENLPVGGHDHGTAFAAAAINAEK